MVTAIVLIKADRHRIPETAEALLEVAGVAEVYSVAGEYDIVAILRVKHYDDLASVVTTKLAKVEGIEKTMTLMAFDCYSKKDVERMWAIGMDS
ncbi:MAG: Lrp/AsnC ligand binding domain-containing protein [Chloroflexi bacterium]|nr:Lrp/AsnC ligand binding domain-containing protein [Chloroflexota bacterium]